MTVVNAGTGLNFAIDMDPDYIDADALPLVKLLVEGKTGETINNIFFIRKQGTLEVVVTLNTAPPTNPGDYVGLVYDSRHPNEKWIATLRLTIYK